VKRKSKPVKVVDKRKANNQKKRKPGHDYRVADNDPMAKDSESNWP
jgi:hypothetical protein